MEAMTTMRKLDLAKIEAARRGEGREVRSLRLIHDDWTREGNVMTAHDFRELALGFDDTEESRSRMGAPDFRGWGSVFATLAHEHLGFGNLMLSPELQQSLVAEAPEAFLPVSRRLGETAQRTSGLREATPEQLLKALPTRLEFASAEER